MMATRGYGGGNLAYQLYNNGGRLDCVNWWQVADWALLGTGLGFARSWFAGMLRTPKGNFTSWRFGTVSKRLRKENGLVGQDVDLHHWLVTQNMMRAMQKRLGKRGKNFVDRAFNRPWNLNRVNRSFHQQTLNRAGYGERLYRGSPHEVRGMAGTAIVSGSVNGAEAATDD